MTVSFRRVLTVLELIFGGLAAVLSALFLSSAVRFDWGRAYPSYEFLQAWLALLAAIAFVMASRLWPPPGARGVLHAVATIAALWLKEEGAHRLRVARCARISNGVRRRSFRPLAKTPALQVERVISVTLVASIALTAVLAGLTASCAPAIDFQPHDARYEECGRRASAGGVAAPRVAVVGTVRQIDDATPVDGPVSIVVIDPAGSPQKLYFGSLFTRPEPSEQRKATYRAIAPSRAGDCVRAVGLPMQDGRIAIDDFVNLDSDSNGRNRR
jgi:hypothetical protein